MGVWLEIPTEIQLKEAHDDPQVPATVQCQRGLKRFKRREERPTEQPMLALRGWFPVPSVIAPSPRSPTLSGICQCTRRLVGFGWIFFLVQDNGETVLLRRLWLEVPPPAQHAKALGHSQDPGQGKVEGIRRRESVKEREAGRSQGVAQN